MKAHTLLAAQWLAHVTYKQMVGPGSKLTLTIRLKSPKSIHIFPNKSKPKTNKRTKTITCNNLCRKHCISACLHIAVAPLKAFWINYFKSLRGSLIWLTNTPAVVTSHINNKCLTVANRDYESAEHGVKQNHMCLDPKRGLTRPRVPLFHHQAGLWAPTTAPPLITCEEFMKPPSYVAVLCQKCL